VTTLADYAARVGGKLVGDGTVQIDRVAAIDDVDDRALTFATDERYLRAALGSRAAAVLTEPAIAEKVEDAGKPLVLVPSARAALAQLLKALEPPRPSAPYRDASAVVDPSARIGADVHIGPLAYVGRDSEIGAGCALLAGAVVGAEARLGAGSTLHPRSMLLDRCVAGERVVLQAGAIVGADGFGYAFVDGRFHKIPQVGNVVLGDDVEIGANTCIDRAQTGSTSVGTGTKIDNLVQIGHNCQIGKHSALAAMCGLAGSAKVGDYVKMGGQSAVNGHVTVGSRVTIAGNTMIWSDVPDGVSLSGAPAQNHRDELRQQVWLRNLGKLYERVSALERR
jgi:UDP-3-O-[3-hydroxymyristoyl] glucosamine N-acyltransferase